MKFRISDFGFRIFREQNLSTDPMHEVESEKRTQSECRTAGCYALICKSEIRNSQSELFHGQI
jgi:hypothetical protein